jgi:uncharacterized membrane protein YfcA
VPALLSPGGVIGVPLGVYIFQNMNDGIFRACVGTILVTYCSFMLMAAKLPTIKVGGRLADGGIGLVSGVMGGAGGLAGPAPIIWCALRGWDMHTQRATFQPLFIVIQVLTLAIYASTGAITSKTLHMFALVAPAVVIPTWLGAKAYKFIPEANFRKLLLLLLLMSGW